MNEDNNLGTYSPSDSFDVSIGEEESPAEHIASDIIEEDDPHNSSRRKKSSSDRRNRVDVLVHENGGLQQQNKFLAQQLEEERAMRLREREMRLQEREQLESYQTQLHKKDVESNEYYETSLDAYEASVTERIKKAIEDGDVDGQIALTSELADVKAKKNVNQLAQHNKYERQAQELRLRQMQEETYAPVEPSPEVPPTPAVNVHFQDWIEENPWFQESPRLRKEAEQIGQDLADRLAFNKQSHVIGTPDFYDKISELMSAQYKLGDHETMGQQTHENPYIEQEAPAMKQQPNPFTGLSPVAPVTRRTGNTMADQYVSDKSNAALRTLSKEEFAIARHLPVRKRGENEVDLVRRFSAAKNYPKSPLPGGTPYRLTIV